MPVYEYLCPECEYRFEELIKSITSKKRVDCPKCGYKDVSRQLSVVAAPQSQSSSPKPGVPAGGCQGCDAAGGSCPYGMQE